MFEFGLGQPLDPGVAAVFARHGLANAPQRIPFGGKWSLLGGVELNAFASPDHLWSGVELPAGVLANYLPWSLTRVIPGINFPSVTARPKEPASPDGTSSQPALAIQGGAVQLGSADFDNRFDLWAVDSRAVAALIDAGMLQWLLASERVTFQLQVDKLSALIQLANWNDSPGAALELLFQFCEGFVERLPATVRSEFAAAG